MTPREFSLLAKRHNREQESCWQRAAMIAHTIYSMAPGERAPKKLEDFMPGAKAQPVRYERTPEDMLRQVKMLHKAFQVVPEGRGKRRGR